ncbi:MAG: hypothetical protein JSS75_07260 [Bacteroidetes bacterium]|nr:hypothetical protein [Bacteroidota bacterium]
MNEQQYVDSIIRDLDNAEDRLFQITHAELVERAYRWLLKSGCGIAFRELVAATQSGEIPDVIGFGNWKSVVIECKASRSDFLADKKKHFRQNPANGMGRFRLYCCGWGLIKPNELPDKWGLLWVGQKGTRAVINPIGKREHCFEEFDIQSEQAMMYSALRRIHLRKGLDVIYEPFTPKGDNA